MGGKRGCGCILERGRMEGIIGLFDCVTSIVYERVLGEKQPPDLSTEFHDVLPDWNT